MSKQEKDCVFCKIIRKELPRVILYEDDTTLVILDKFPATKGQSLVIPKHHVDYILDTDESTYLHLFDVARTIARATDAALKPVRTCFVVEGFAVPHVHIRLHPAYEHRLLLQGSEASQTELENIAGTIRKEL